MKGDVGRVDRGGGSRVGWGVAESGKVRGCVRWCVFLSCFYLSEQRDGTSESYALAYLAWPTEAELNPTLAYLAQPTQAELPDEVSIRAKHHAP